MTRAVTTNLNGTVRSCTHWSNHINHIEILILRWRCKSMMCEDSWIFFHWNHVRKDVFRLTRIVNYTYQWQIESSVILNALILKGLLYHPKKMIILGPSGRWWNDGEQRRSHNADSHLGHGETGPIPRFIKGNQLFREEDIPEVVAIREELERANPEWKTEPIRVTPQRMSNDGANVCESYPLLWFRMGYYANTYNFATSQDMGLVLFLQ